MMRIVCPACAAAYDVPDALFKAGRRTRCARCGETWAPVPESRADPLAAEAPPVEPAAPTDTVVRAELARRQIAEQLEPQPLDRLVGAAPLPPPRPGSGVWIGWLASLVVLAALGWGAYTYRTAVMQTWPPSTRVYAALGLVR